MGKKIKVTYFDDIAEEVKKIEAAMKYINAGNLTKDAVIILVQASTGENKGTIKNVLYGLETIGKYLKK